MNETLKRYLMSSLVTFIAMFLLTFLPQISDITLEGFTVSAFVAMLTTAVRAGVKAGIEVLIPYLQSLLNR